MVKKSYSKHNKLLLFIYYRNYWVSLPLHTFLYPFKRMLKGIFGWKTFTTYSLNYVRNILETLEKDLWHMLAKVQRKKVEIGRKQDIKEINSLTKGGSCTVRYTEESILGKASYKQDPDLAAHKVTRCWLPRGQRWWDPPVPLADLPPLHAFLEAMIWSQVFPLPSITFL